MDDAAGVVVTKIGSRKSRMKIVNANKIEGEAIPKSASRLS
jgi:hypothetical protein